MPYYEYSISQNNTAKEKEICRITSTAYPKITPRGHNSKYHCFSLMVRLYHIQIEKSRVYFKFAPRLSKERVHFFMQIKVKSYG